MELDDEINYLFLMSQFEDIIIGSENYQPYCTMFDIQQSRAYDNYYRCYQVADVPGVCSSCYRPTKTRRYKLLPFAPSATATKHFIDWRGAVMCRQDARKIPKSWWWCQHVWNTTIECENLADVDLGETCSPRSLPAVAYLKSWKIFALIIKLVKRCCC